MRLHAVGRRLVECPNKGAARLAGLNTSAVKWMVFSVLGTLTGLAAVLNAVRFNQIPSNAGIGLEMKVIASVVIGLATTRDILESPTLDRHSLQATLKIVAPILQSLIDP